MDLNSATGSFLGAVLALLIFCTKEEGYPLETSTDDKCFFSHFAAVSRKPAQRQNECACSADLGFERESITNAPLQSPNSHLLPQYFFLLNEM